MSFAYCRDMGGKPSYFFFLQHLLAPPSDRLLDVEEGAGDNTPVADDLDLSRP